MLLAGGVRWGRARPRCERRLPPASLPPAGPDAAPCWPRTPRAGRLQAARCAPGERRRACWWACLRCWHTHAHSAALALWRSACPPPQHSAAPHPPRPGPALAQVKPDAALCSRCCRCADIHRQLDPLEALHVYSVLPGQPKDPSELWAQDGLQSADFYRQAVAANQVGRAAGRPAAGQQPALGPSPFRACCRAPLLLPPLRAAACWWPRRASCTAQQAPSPATPSARGRRGQAHPPASLPAHGSRGCRRPCWLARPSATMVAWRRSPATPAGKARAACPQPALLPAAARRSQRHSAHSPPLPLPPRQRSHVEAPVRRRVGSTAQHDPQQPSSMPAVWPPHEAGDGHDPTPPCPSPPPLAARIMQCCPV